ncbi:ORF18a [black bullhead herpesvirus]|uniref:ORF18a n=1 Tax=black bullhead herpesvirus TaxID=508441 RepID=A0A2H5AJE6_9VIRU|nr:ORF18a [black bullhead herpesvirus]AUG72273.1 ORF18a [black bullhead herpesvirus]
MDQAGKCTINVDGAHVATLELPSGVSTNLVMVHTNQERSGSDEPGFRQTVPTKLVQTTLHGKRLSARPSPISPKRKSGSGSENEPSTSGPTKVARGVAGTRWTPRLDVWAEQPTRLCLLNPDPLIGHLLHTYMYASSVQRSFGLSPYTGEPRFIINGYSDHWICGHLAPLWGPEFLAEISHSVLFGASAACFCPRYTNWAKTKKRFVCGAYELYTVIIQSGDVLEESVTDWLKTLTPEERESVRIIERSKESMTLQEGLNIVKDILRGWDAFSTSALPGRYAEEFEKLSKDGDTFEECLQVELVDPIGVGVMEMVTEGLAYRVDLPGGVIPKTFSVILQHHRKPLKKVRVELKETIYSFDDYESSIFDSEEEDWYTP